MRIHCIRYVHFDSYKVHGTCVVSTISCYFLRLYFRGMSPATTVLLNLSLILGNKKRFCALNMTDCQPCQ